MVDARSHGPVHAEGDLDQLVLVGAVTRELLHLHVGLRALRGHEELQPDVLVTEHTRRLRVGRRLQIEVELVGRVLLLRGLELPDLPAPLLEDDRVDAADERHGQYFAGLRMREIDREGQLYEKDDLISRVLVDNSARRTRQKKLDIRVVVANPPYSVGQGSQNDNNQNVAYPSLDERIAETYGARSTAVNGRLLYDSYVRAIRWASDRVGESGIVGFVTNAGFIEANTADGLRRCLVDEFTSLYVFHLRGNQRTSGELSRKEGGKVFGSGSRAPVAISILVKNPKTKERGQIFFRDVGDYRSREEKLAAVGGFGSIAGISAEEGWTRITPDEHGDWLKQRDESYGSHVVLGVKGKSNVSLRLFQSFSLGVGTNRDAWAYILHAVDYRERYADNLGKELPRIPRVKAATDFWAFSKAGRALGELHVGYEQVPEYAAMIDAPASPTGAHYRVVKMKFGKGKDKSVVHYNDFITVREIPLEAYDYVVNGSTRSRVAPT